MGFCSLVLRWCGIQPLESHRDEVSMSHRACGITKASVSFRVKLHWQPSVPPSNKPTSPAPLSLFLILLRCPQILKQWKLHSILTQFAFFVSSNRSSVKLKCLLWIFPSLVIPQCESQAHLYLDPLGVTPTHSTRGCESFFFKLRTVIHASLSKPADKPADILLGSALQSPTKRCHNK